MKKISALLILSLILAVFCCTSVVAAESPALYSYYADNMLFRQNDEAVIAGKAESGTVINCTLKNSLGEQVACSEAVASADNTFSLSFTAPAGGFEEYTVTVTANGQVIRELKGVVFGELWLAGGQSNMHWTLMDTAEGYDMACNNQRGSSAIRMLYAPHPGTYKGDVDKIPATPVTDYESGAKWYRGDDVAIFSSTAVGYFFAESMLEELNVPVGIIDANLGGTSILTWLPREAIENNPEVLNDCKADGRYIPLNKWNESKMNAALDMTANFNRIINPLKNFRLSGMIWYQGEGDVSWSFGRYSRAFDALQNAYTEHFSYKDGRLPIVFTQLSSYSYGELTILQNTNAEFAHIQQQDHQSRALTSILDTPHDYTVNTYPIHPYYKKEISEKMAYAAKGLVYGLNDCYTAATVSASEIRDGSIYVTFRDVGDGLITDGESLRAFSICGKEGVYVSAKAEIVSKDTIRIYSPSVPEPKSAAYAYTQSNIHANLFSSADGEKLFAVSPFVTDMNYGRHHWHNDPWATCDYDVFWRCHEGLKAGYYNTWNSSGAEISFNRSEIDTGNALYIVSDKEQFSVSPNLLFEEDGKNVFFRDADLNWADYDTLTFKVRLESGASARFDGLKIKVNNVLTVMPAVIGTKDTGVTLEADGKAHTVTLDLNKLYHYGNVNLATSRASILDYVRGFEFIFSDISGIGVQLCIDDINFGVAESSSDDNQSQGGEELSFFDKIINFFRSIFEKISGFFRNLF